MRSQDSLSQGKREQLLNPSTRKWHISLPLRFHWPKQVSWPRLMSKCEAWHAVSLYVLERRGEQRCGHLGALELGRLGRGTPPSWGRRVHSPSSSCTISTQVPWVEARCNHRTLSAHLGLLKLLRSGIRHTVPVPWHRSKTREAGSTALPECAVSKHFLLWSLSLFLVLSRRKIMGRG